MTSMTLRLTKNNCKYLLLLVYSGGTPTLRVFFIHIIPGIKWFAKKNCAFRSVVL